MVLDFHSNYQPPGKARPHTRSALTTQLHFYRGTEQVGCAWRPKRFGPLRAGGQIPGSSLHRLLRVLALAPLICGLPFAPAARVPAVPGVQRPTDRPTTPNRAQCPSCWPAATRGPEMFSICYEPGLETPNWPTVAKSDAGAFLGYRSFGVSMFKAGPSCPDAELVC